MKCTYCQEDVFDSKDLPIGIELPMTSRTLHKCNNNKIVRLVGLRRAGWFVFEEIELKAGDLK